MRAYAWMGVAVVAAVGIGFGVATGRGDPAATMTAAAAPAAARKISKPALHLPRIAGTGLVEVGLDAAQLDAASRAGRLRVVAAGIAPYEVQVDGWVAEPNGRRTLLGRVRTAFGSERMVLSEGAGAIAGVLPRPDGGHFQVVTQHGRVMLAEAAGLVPDGNAPEGHSDIVLPPSIAVPSPGQPAVAGAPAAPAVSAKALAPVEVDVLMAYTDELVTLRGSPEAAETEATSMFAAARQSYVDSGTRVRLRAVRYLRIAVDTSWTNHQLLSRAQGNSIPGVDLAAERDSVSADLVAVVRPRRDGDGTCGVGYLNGHEFTHAFASAAYGYSVSNTAPCGPHVLAHELGHNLGSSHERDQYLDSGALQYGAYVFSFGYRQSKAPAFATVMAYTRGEPWVGYFSSPTSGQCQAPCGVADVADNVRSLDLMAPVIAAFRRAPGTVSLSGSSQYEPDPDYPGDMYFMGRVSGRAPAGGVSFRVEDAGGTARPGTDYEVPTGTFTIPEGQSEVYVRVPLLADRVAEGDETVRLRLVEVQGAAVGEATGESVLLEDDPRHAVSGRLHLPAGGPVPGATPTLMLCQSASAGCSHWIPLFGPDYRFSFGALNALPLIMEVYFNPQDPYVGERFVFAPVRAGFSRDFRASRALRLHGQVVPPAGDPPLTGTVDISISHSRDGRVSYASARAQPPDYRYEAFVPRDAWITLNVAANGTYRRYYIVNTRVSADLEQKIELSRSAALYAWAPPTAEPRDASEVFRTSVIFSLAEPAPEGGVRLAYRAVDGSAVVGRDVRIEPGILEIPAGGRSASFSYDVVGDAQIEGDEHFFVEVGDVTGATAVASRFAMWITEPAPDMGGPLRPMPAD